MTTPIASSGCANIGESTALAMHEITFARVPGATRIACGSIAWASSNDAAWYSRKRERESHSSTEGSSVVL